MRIPLLALALVAVVLMPLQTATALTLSPARLEVSADPGGRVAGTIELFNEETTQKTFYTSMENFEPRGESGAPYFVGANGGLATWITVIPEVTVASGERVKVDYAINVPPGTEPGGYFAAVFFGSQPPQASGGGEVSIGGKIGTLVLLRVNGDIPESGGLLDFMSDKRFLSSLPLTFSYRINNTGGDRVVPKGEIVVQNTLRLKSATLLANRNEGSVLPGSARKFDVPWGDAVPEEERGYFGTAWKQIKEMRLGWYTASLQVSWGTTGQSAEDTIHFFILPWQALSILLAVLLVIYFAFRILLRRYNRWIINQAMRQRQ